MGKTTCCAIMSVSIHPALWGVRRQEMLGVLGWLSSARVSETCLGGIT